MRPSASDVEPVATMVSVVSWPVAGVEVEVEVEVETEGTEEKKDEEG